MSAKDQNKTDTVKPENVKMAYYGQKLDLNAHDGNDATSSRKCLFRNGKTMPRKVFDVLNEVVVDRGSNPYLSKIKCYEHDHLIAKGGISTTSSTIWKRIFQHKLHVVEPRQTSLFLEAIENANIKAQKDEDAPMEISDEEVEKPLRYHTTRRMEVYSKEEEEAIRLPNHNEVTKEVNETKKEEKPVTVTANKKKSPGHVTFTGKTRRTYQVTHLTTTSFDTRATICSGFKTQNQERIEGFVLQHIQ
ncbi:probable NAD kinase 2, chloroplastic isoform X2 [Tanacetum coccineum]